MNVSAFRVANFKAFAAGQRVPLRPITLVYGANSAGKSSVLHALALSHHAIETGDLDTQRTQIGGESIDLGGFRQYVHRHRREQQVQIGFELDLGRLSGRVAALLRSAGKVVIELSIGEGMVGGQQDLRAGAWRGLFASNGRDWHRWGKELVRKLAMEGRLVGFLPELPAVPSDDQDWCEEALKTDAKQRFTGGIIVTEPVKAAYPAEPRVERIDQLSRAAWWSRRSVCPGLWMTTRNTSVRFCVARTRCSSSILTSIPRFLDINSSRIFCPSPVGVARGRQSKSTAFATKDPGQAAGYLTYGALNRIIVRRLLPV